MKTTNLKAAMAVLLVTQSLDRSVLLDVGDGLSDEIVENPTDNLAYLLRGIDAIMPSLAQNQDLDAGRLKQAYPNDVQDCDFGSKATKIRSLYDFVHSYAEDGEDLFCIGTRPTIRMAFAFRRAFAGCGMPNGHELSKAFNGENPSPEVIRRMGDALREALEHEDAFVERMLGVLKLVHIGRLNAERRNQKCVALHGIPMDGAEAYQATVEHYQRYCQYSLGALGEALCMVLPVLMMALGRDCEDALAFVRMISLDRIINGYRKHMRELLGDCDELALSENFLREPWRYFYVSVEQNEELYYGIAELSVLERDFTHNMTETCCIEVSPQELKQMLESIGATDRVPPELLNLLNELDAPNADI